MLDERDLARREKQARQRNQLEQWLQLYQQSVVARGTQAHQQRFAQLQAERREQILAQWIAWYSDWRSDVTPDGDRTGSAQRAGVTGDPGLLAPTFANLPYDLPTESSPPDTAFSGAHRRLPVDFDAPDADPIAHLGRPATIVIGASRAPGGVAARAVRAPLGPLASAPRLRQPEPSDWQPVPPPGTVGSDSLASGASGFAGAVLAIVVLFGLSLWRSLERQRLRLPASLTGAILVPPG
jgi:hypothetical protein